MTDITVLNDVTVEYLQHMGSDAMVVAAARASLKGANEVYMGEGEVGLINYLVREKHGSPFEHTGMTHYVKAPIFVFREWHRHRMASYNEMSGRYTELPDEFYIPSEERKLINVGTSARPEFAPGTIQQYLNMAEDTQDVYEFAWKKYQKMLGNGIANEVARQVLPVGIMSQMYVTMNLRSAFNFLALRTHRKDAVHISRPQREIEMAAEKVEATVEELFPVSYAAYNKYGRVAP